MKQRHLTRRIVVAALTAGFFAAIASAYFFSATAKNILKSTAAIAIQSWDDTFGGTDGGYVMEISPAAGDMESSSTDSSSVMYGDQDGSMTASGDLGNPVVTLEMATDTAVALVATDATDVTDTASAASTTDDGAALPPPPSPAHCTVSTAAALSRELIFNEVAWMGSPPRADETASAASNREWIELKNISGARMMSPAGRSWTRRET